MTVWVQVPILIKKKGFRKASSMLHMILAVFWCAVEHTAWVLK